MCLLTEILWGILDYQLLYVHVWTRASLRSWVRAHPQSGGVRPAAKHDFLMKATLKKTGGGSDETVEVHVPELADTDAAAVGEDTELLDVILNLDEFDKAFVVETKFQGQRRGSLLKLYELLVACSFEATVPCVHLQFQLKVPACPSQDLGSKCRKGQPC